MLARCGGVVLVLMGSLQASSYAAQPVTPILEDERPDQPPGTPARDDAFARTPGRRVAFGSYQSIQINVDAQAHNIVGDAANEPSIAVNPVNPSNMVVGWRQFATVASNFREAGWGYTFDGGQSWAFPGVIEPGVFRSDPVVDVDSSGTFFYLSFRGAVVNRSEVFRSTDGGVSWSAGVTAYGGDKNWLAVDRTGGESDGFLHVIWNRFTACCGSQVYTRSTTGGATFDTLNLVMFSPIYGTMAVGPSGEVYASGFDGTSTRDFDHYVVVKSINARDPVASVSFTGTRVDLGGTAGGGAPNPQGLTGQPNVFVNGAPGSRQGQVYLLASLLPAAGSALQAPDPMDVHIARSFGEAEGWYPPVRVNDDVVNSWRNWQWMAEGAVAPNGRIDAIWFDTRNSGVANVSQLFYAYSWDGGTTWSPNVPVTPAFDSTIGYPQQNKLGDYITLVSNDTGADVAYAATFNGEQDVYYVRVFPDCNGNGVSDVTDVASPEVFDCNANQVPDDCEAAPVCLGVVAVTGGLTVERSPAGDLMLQWDASCSGAEDDFAIYEGTLGSFASPAPRRCTTAGATSGLLTPSPGDTYYLVVPIHADREGSYGEDGAGNPRPAAAGACFPQDVRACGS